jgi:hypothetical protein
MTDSAAWVPGSGKAVELVQSARSEERDASDDARPPVGARSSEHPVAYLENLMGQIREGFAADLMVLDRDLQRVPLKRVPRRRWT